MKYAYFPGCTLRNKAAKFDICARRSAEVLGAELCEIPEWQCCGGAFTAKDEIAAKLPAVRTLIAARDFGSPLITVCAACHNVVKQTNHLVRTDSEFREKVNLYLKGDKEPSSYRGETEVLHFLELIKRIGFDKVSQAVRKPLNGKKVACYYGCMLLRPSKIIAFDDPEDPSVMEDLVSALGGEPIYFPERNECCGSYLVLEDEKAARGRSGEVANDAKNHGAEVIVTACPLCRYNLLKSGTDIPVLYFTELMAEALGVTEETI